MSDKNKLSLGDQYFVQYYAPEFGTYDLRHERLHPEDKIEKPLQALTETQYFGFFVPEENLHCFIWIWHHPNLNTVQGGVMAWKGWKPLAVSCELYDFRAHLDASNINDFVSYTLDSRISIEQVELGKVFRVRYDDPERGNSFDVIQTAASEVLMWPSNKHFEQVMKCEGSITLRGKTHKVDCFSIRDRSWGEYRLEDPMAIPPNTWTTCVVDENFSFLVTIMDDPSRKPIWDGKFDVDPASTLRFGWMVVDGEKVTVKSVSAHTEFDEVHLLPKTISLTIVDSRDRTYELEGVIAAVTPLPGWMNTRVPICLVKWTYQGRQGIGEMQQCQFNDFLYSVVGEKTYTPA